MQNSSRNSWKFRNSQKIVKVAFLENFNRFNKKITQDYYVGNLYYEQRHFPIYYDSQNFITKKILLNQFGFLEYYFKYCDPKNNRKMFEKEIRVETSKRAVKRIIEKL